MTSLQNLNQQKGANDDQDSVEQSATSSSRNSRRGKSKGAFRTISEVAETLGVQQHVLRFWETKFSQIRPLKRGGGRRYYRPEDLALLQRIHELLYTQGYTIKGVQKLLKEQGKNKVLHGNAGMPEAVIADAAPVFATKSAKAAGEAGQEGALSSKQRRAVQSMLAELRELRDLLKAS